MNTSTLKCRLLIIGSTLSLFLIVVRGSLMNSIIPGVKPGLPRKDQLIGKWELVHVDRLTGSNAKDGKIEPSLISGHPIFVFPCSNMFLGCYSVASEGPVARYDGLNNPETFTIAFWFKSASTAAYTGLVTIGNRVSFAYEPTTKCVQPMQYDGEKWVTLSSLPCVWQQDSQFPPEQWIFYAVSVNRSEWESTNEYTARIYTKTIGQKMSNPGCLTITLPWQANVTTYVELGTGRTVETNKWAHMTVHDQLADVSFYGVALTEAEISTLSTFCCVWDSDLDRDDGMHYISPKYLIRNRNDNVTLQNAIDRTIYRGEDSYFYKGRNRPMAYSTETLVTEMKQCLPYFDAALYTPVQSVGEAPLPIKIKMDIQHFNGISNTEQAIAVRAAITLGWSVGGCQRPQSHNVADPSSVQLVPATADDKKNIWQPTLRFLTAVNSDIYMKNVATGDELSILRHLEQINENQTYEFQWSREGSFVADCSLQLERFPFDTQSCSFDFTINRGINFTFLEVGTVDGFTIDPDAFRNTEWKLTSTALSSGLVKFAATNVSLVSFSVTVKRIPDFYVQNLFAPTFVLGVLELGTFLMPPSEISRPAYAVTLVLAFTVSQSDVLDRIPNVPQHNLLSNYVQNLEWFSAGVTLYALFTILLSEPIFGWKLPAKYLRLIDAITLVLTLAIFAVMNYIFLQNIA